MFSIWFISLIAVVYLGVLFAVAGWADRRKVLPFKGMIYGLSLGVNCTSWDFYGTTAQAASNGWWLAPTYAGTIIYFWLAIVLPHCTYLSTTKTHVIS